jgi:O-antigen ligase
LLAATGLGFVHALVLRERPSRWLMVAVTLILAQGWTMTLNSRGLFAETTGLFAPLEQRLNGWPGSVERDLSWETMTRITALLGAALVAAALGKSRRWRGRLVHVLVATSVSLVVLGCAQRWSHAGDIFWGTSRRLDYFFGTFRNVTNAGEFINLAVPLAAALAWNARDRSPFYKTWTVCVLAILVAGSCICGSKVAPLLTVGLGAFFLLLHAREIRRLPMRGSTSVIVALALGGAVGLMIWGGGIDVTQDRWHRLFDSSGDATLTDRLRVDHACIAGLPEAGLLGFGPGTFPAVFPGLEQRLADLPPGRWLFAHNDYLQTALEWGALGAAAWALYLYGAIVALVRGLRRSVWPSEDRTCAIGLLAALVGVGIMALADFPLQIASLQLDVAVIAGLAWSSRAWPRARSFRR